MTSYALHYLSKIPESITDKNSPAWNRDSMFVSRSSPLVAIEAFAQQASDDLSIFLHSRAQELVTGGILLLMFPIRLSHELNEADFPFQSVWKDLIQEGLVSQESLDTFNFPAYLRSGDEVRSSGPAIHCHSLGKSQVSLAGSKIFQLCCHGNQVLESSSSRSTLATRKWWSSCMSECHPRLRCRLLLESWILSCLFSSRSNIWRMTLSIGKHFHDQCP
ncbi:gibberellic acid methyltransferase 2 [Selaginella moellendorffii]|uniref:gibberellic acid methyltransferase 2 n=1 Tax=Selaginella moellendorffii TaxID=88036 RepID=UPI000D1CC16A|nr:gibberellic acid methyltransferase 2 [Selaginella moellendorffii]|eukprot:XP_024527798.1 gibberellic acid methyltransferase 2 [Selaginella moellendorffii]